MRYAFALVLLVVVACGGGGASVACEEFLSRDRGAEAKIDLGTEVVEEVGETDDGATVYRVTGDATIGSGAVSFTCQVRHSNDQWTLEGLIYD